MSVEAIAMFKNVSRFPNSTVDLCVNISQHSNSLSNFCANSSFGVNTSDNSVLEQPEPRPDWMNTVDSVYMWLNILLMPLVLIGNLLVMVSICKYQALRKVANVFIASLSFADFFLGLVTLPLYAISFMNHNQISKYYCLMKYSCVLFSMSASLISLICVAVDRYIAIIHPFAYANLMAWRNVRRILLGLWGYHIIIFILPVAGYNNWHEGICDYFRTMMLPFSIVTTILAIAVCLVTGLYLYTRIFLEARRQRIAIAKSQCLMSATAVRQFRRDTKAAKVVATVLFIFFVFWCPFLITGILKYFPISQYVVETMKNGALWLAMSNSCVNPIVYCWMQRDFRNAFKKLVCPCLISKDSRTESAKHSLRRNALKDSKIPSETLNTITVCTNVHNTTGVSDGNHSSNVYSTTESAVQHGDSDDSLSSPTIYTISTNNHVTYADSCIQDFTANPNDDILQSGALTEIQTISKSDVDD